MTIVYVLIALVLGLILGSLLARNRAQDSLLALRTDLSTAKVDLAKAWATLDERERAQVDLETRLKDLANTAFQNARQTLAQDSTQREEAVKGILEPVTQGLENLRLYVDNQKTQISADITSLSTQTSELNKATTSLTATLSSNHGAGTWGEVSLENVVRYSGMMKWVDYIPQKQLEGEGERGRPDLRVKLPGGRQILVDAKVPRSAFARAFAVDVDPVTKKNELTQHAKDVKQRIQELADRSYWTKLGDDIRTIEAVVMFVPNESYLISAFEVSPDLLDFAYKSNVLLATPGTLVMLLKAAHHIWREEERLAQAEEISQACQELLTRLGTSLSHLNNIGRALDAASKAYNDFGSSMNSRTLVQGEKVKKYLNSSIDLRVKETGITVDPLAQRIVTSIESSKIYDESEASDLEDAEIDEITDIKLSQEIELSQEGN